MLTAEERERVMREEVPTQMIFDFVAEHLLRQGKRAMAVIGGASKCAYRGEGGTSCAYGCLLRDEEYNRKMEGWDVYFLWRSGLMPERHVLHRSLLSGLQSAHDIYGDNEVALAANLKVKASDYGLSSSIIDEVLNDL